ncbi:MAG: hypothetical protein IH830_01825 [Planctomycetes bacterium]|nr:hypothetical protein [Planctomycetota bacterium]
MPWGRDTGRQPADGRSRLGGRIVLKGRAFTAHFAMTAGAISYQTDQQGVEWGSFEANSPVVE